VLGVELSKKYEKRTEKNKTIKAGDISFDRPKTPFPVIRTLIFSRSSSYVTRSRDILMTNNSSTYPTLSRERMIEIHSEAG